MTQPTPPVAPPPPPPNYPTPLAGNFTNPAFVLSLIPTIDFIATTFFHSDLGLSRNATQWSLIISGLAAGLVATAAYVSRIFHHKAYTEVWKAWLAYLASQTGTQVTTVNGSGVSQVTTVPVTTTPAPDPVDPPDPGGYQGEGGNQQDVDPGNLPRRAISTTRSAQKRTAGRKQTTARGR